jgi:hypothetical protein
MAITLTYFVLINLYSFNYPLFYFYDGLVSLAVDSYQRWACWFNTTEYISFKLYLWSKKDIL